MNTKKTYILILSLILIITYGFAVAERYYNIECFSDQICVYKDTKSDKFDEKKEKGEKRYKIELNSDIYKKPMIKSRPDGITVLYGLTIYGNKKTYIGCFNKFLIP